MKFSFSPSSTDLKKVEEGTQLLLGDIKSEKELEIQVEFQENTPLTVTRDGDHLQIICQEPAHYYRGLNWAVHHLEDTWNTKSEPVYFSKNGVMLDCSRNAVFTVEKVKSFIRIMAKLGMNTLMLYTEETYTVPDEPYFGAYRGRYSQDEIREMDAYARTFGIELVPCIQTLAHLHNALKWPLGDTVKDTADILQVGKEEVYTLIEKMLRSVKESFSTNRVHLGMDEAAQLGLGKYLRENGYTKSSVLIREHSARVFEICKKLGLEPMIWSDMYITANTGGGYYDLADDTDCSDWEKPDPELGLVYWDYYNPDQKIYEKMIRVHQQLSNKVIFAGGSWIWNGISPNYSKTFTCTRAGLAACKKYHLPEVFCTAWMDNGAETPVDAVLPGLVLFAHLGFHEDFDEKALTEEFHDVTGAYLNDFLELDALDSLFQNGQPNLDTDNPSKYLLYQDPLLGIFDRHIEDLDLDTERYYQDLADRLEICGKHSPAYDTLFAFYRSLASTLAGKADLGVRLKKAYDAHDLSTLETICEEVIPGIINDLSTTKLLREDLWMQEAKPFGYELVDIKLSGVIARLTSTRRRLRNYIDGKVPHLEELEATRLPYFLPGTPKRENLWHRIISGADLMDTI